MRTDDYLADYARLGLQPGCSVDALQRTWRLAVRDLHPDRIAAGLDEASRSQRLHELTAAYRRLRSFEREHGRLPGGTLAEPLPVQGFQVPAAQVPAAADSAGTGSSAGMSGPSSLRVARGFTFWVVLALGVLLALSGLLQSEPSDEAALAAEPLKAPIHGASVEVAAAAAGPGLRIRVGSTEAQVERLMGAPMVTQADLWEYGPSHVRFERGRVVGWYSSPLKPLPVEIESR
ncbi:MAG: J domain-containing protein [Xanthomonadales bacterium]|nr:J domain-containing protein [Xanthomonadales bacterium]